MEISEIIPHIEVLIFASEKPLTSPDIVELINNTFGFLEERISTDQVDAAVISLNLLTKEPSVIKYEVIISIDKNPENKFSNFESL